MWNDLEKEQKKIVIEQTSLSLGIPLFAVEKDWWVCIVLKAIFQSKYANFVFFKGGTSLSKAYHLIDRFSEDVDLILDKKVLGFDSVSSKTKIKQVRKASGSFIINEFRKELIVQLEALGISSNHYRIEYNLHVDDTSDPNTLAIFYSSIVPDPSNYIQKRVLLEIGARSLTEPIELKDIMSFLDKHYSSAFFSMASFSVQTVLPTRTFLEKVLLLHEEFSKPIDTIRTERLSRHLYDVECLMRSPYGSLAIADDVLFDLLVEHRQLMTPIRGLNYSNHKKGKLSILPPEEVMNRWKTDYATMQEYMIIGESLPWVELLRRIKDIENKLNRNEI
ncbi:nucleotidyl transferase AbiEii/AbiGii toxin family protein [Myroides sp. WP-1]|uniref:nucleotidyl transferase AbiEii/AbiGii toxin family protein n=1 Tax=Myroides sp. WP-1 TaxID=2759944 RepID=UPI0015FE41D8|nr:nucleotidyl transferase AbiEii/AbiGii toxin family protein [Myroides sp. WP-1]MBB1138381.1 nucleotidyl transferase AbiEii/AbiGii toxin family protein [Myroides sp. WP-1]